MQVSSSPHSCWKFIPPTLHPFVWHMQSLSTNVMTFFLLSRSCEVLPTRCFSLGPVSGILILETWSFKDLVEMQQCVRWWWEMWETLRKSKVIHINVYVTLDLIVTFSCHLPAWHFLSIKITAEWHLDFMPLQTAVILLMSGWLSLPICAETAPIDHCSNPFTPLFIREILKISINNSQKLIFFIH